MRTHPSISASLPVALMLVLGACEQSSLEPVESPDVASQPAPMPASILFEEVVYDVNPCTGKSAAYTISGSVQHRSFGTGYQLTVSGTTTTSDGFSGSFTAQTHVQPGQTAAVRLSGQPLTDKEGLRIRYGIELTYQSVGARPTVSLTDYTRARCVTNEL